jgi:hypothetical protein
MPCPTEIRSTWPLAPLLLLMACAQPLLPTPAAAPAAAPVPPPPPPVVVVMQAEPPAPDDVAARQLLAFHERLRTMSGAEQAQTLARMSPAGAPADTLQVVLLLAQTRQPGDLARALALLEPLVRDTSPWSGLARLLQGRLAEQRRLEELNERQAQQLREQQRRLDQLSQQLNALRAIERSLGARPAPASASRP